MDDLELPGGRGSGDRVDETQNDRVERFQYPLIALARSKRQKASPISRYDIPSGFMEKRWFQACARPPMMVNAQQASSRAI